MKRYANMLLCAAAPVLAALPSVARADEPVCMRAGEMEAALIDWYGEYPTPVHRETASATIRLWAAPQSGTWTMVKYLIDGTACVIAEGEDWGGPKQGDALVALARE